jgi:hypothetical protein
MYQTEIEQYAQAITEAAELGDRFPNTPDREVVEHVNYVCKTNLSYDGLHESVATTAVLSAFYADAEAGFRTFAAYAGIDIRPTCKN